MHNGAVENTFTPNHRSGAMQYHSAKDTGRLGGSQTPECTENDIMMMRSQCTKTPSPTNRAQPLTLASSAVTMAHAHSSTPKAKVHALGPHSTPTKLYRNPFEVGLADRLHLQSFSPSVFATVTSPSQIEHASFKWDIEQLANIQPVDIGLSPWKKYESPDPAIEARAQEAIKRFFSQPEIAPSPWSVPSAKIVLHEKPQLTKTSNAWTQTSLSFPPVLPPEVEQILAKYMCQELPVVGQSPRSDSDESNLNASSLRRKLFSHLEESPDDEQPSTSHGTKPYSSPPWFDNVESPYPLPPSMDVPFVPPSPASPCSRSFRSRSPSLSPISESRLSFVSMKGSQDANMVVSLNMDGYSYEDGLCGRFEDEGSNIMDTDFQSVRLRDQSDCTLSQTAREAQGHSIPLVDSMHVSSDTGYMSSSLPGLQNSEWTARSLHFNSHVTRLPFEVKEDFNGKEEDV